MTKKHYQTDNVNNGIKSAKRNKKYGRWQIFAISQNQTQTKMDVSDLF